MKPILIILFSIVFTSAFSQWKPLTPAQEKLPDIHTMKPPFKEGMVGRYMGSEYTYHDKEWVLTIDLPIKNKMKLARMRIGVINPIDGGIITLDPRVDQKLILGKKTYRVTSNSIILIKK